MDYEIIFYHSGKTAETERLLERKLSRIGLERKASTAAMSPSELAQCLKRALSRSCAALIIGGLDGSRQSADSILSAVLAPNAGKLRSERLLDENGNEAFLIRSGRQCIILFPDETEIIEEMLDKRMLSEMKKFFDLTEDEDDGPSIDEVTKELRRHLSGMSPAGSSYALKYAEKQKRELKLLKILFISLACIGAALIAAAIISLSI